MVTSSRLQKWIASGRFTPDRIFDGIDEQIKVYEAIKKSEKARLREFFDAYAVEGSDGVKRIDENAGVAFLEEAKLLPLRFKNDIGSMLFHSISYASTFPLYHLSVSPRELMTFEELARGLVLLLGRGGYIYETGSRCRARTPADDRRILFQSLASVQGSKRLPFNFEEAQSQAQRRAFDLPAEQSRRLQYCGTNFDKDGDEMYHDLLDVLYSIQPEEKPLVSVSRDEFRSIATELHGDDTHSLHNLSIPVSGFQLLVKFLLSAQAGVDRGANSVDHTESEHAALAIVKSFVQSNDAHGVGVTWETFDNALANSALTLFEPFKRVLASFLGHPYVFPVSKALIPPTPTTRTVLTLPVLEQLGTFLPNVFSFESLELYKVYKPSSSETLASSIATDLASAGVRDPNATTSRTSLILLVSGTVRNSGDPVMAGFFTPAPTEDGESIQSLEVFEGWENALLFQCSPVQSVFRGRVGEPAWTVTDSSLAFGTAQEGGTMLKLSPDLQTASLVQSVASRETERVQGVYAPAKWRGNQEIMIDVSNMELWRQTLSSEDDI